MIKFISTVKTKSGPDRQLLGFGLSRKNIELMIMENRPIHVHLEEMGLTTNQDIIIFFGENEDAMMDELKRQGFIIDEATDYKDKPKRH